MIEVFTDGSCTGNGRPDAMCAMGIYYPMQPERSAAIKARPTYITNDAAELDAVMYSLYTNPHEGSLAVYTGSKYVVDCLTVFYKNGLSRNGPPPRETIEQSGFYKVHA